MEDELINRIGFYMEQALGNMTTSLAAAFSAQGINLPHSQYAVLRLLYSRQEPLTQKAIAETLKKDAAAIKRTIDILERKELVVRTALNGRTNCVVCTAKAIGLKTAIIDIANRTLHDLFHDFTDEELVVFTSTLCRIAKLKNV